MCSHCNEKNARAAILVEAAEMAQAIIADAKSRAEYDNAKVTFAKIEPLLSFAIAHVRKDAKRVENKRDQLKFDLKDAA